MPLVISSRTLTRNSFSSLETFSDEGPVTSTMFQCKFSRDYAVTSNGFVSETCNRNPAEILPWFFMIFFRYFLGFLNGFLLGFLQGFRGFSNELCGECFSNTTIPVLQGIDFRNFNYSITTEVSSYKYLTDICRNLFFEESSRALPKDFCGNY